MRPFGRDREPDLETRLQKERPEPSAEFLASVEDRISSAGTVRRPKSRLRYGLAAGFAASVAVVFGAFGGFGTFSVENASSRVTLAVPSSALPAVKALQAKGAILAASPVKYTKAELKAGKVKGIVLAPTSPDVKAAAAKATAEKSGLKLAPVDKAIRTNLIPSSAGRGSSVIRLAATVVYVPGIFVPICYPVGGGVYYSFFVPVAQVGSYVPPGTYGFCPGFNLPPV